MYDILSSSFDDPSATIVYPYVYRILNSSSVRQAPAAPGPRDERNRNGNYQARTFSPPESRADSPLETASSAASGDIRPSSPSHRTSRSVTSISGTISPPVEEPDPDAQLLLIIGHISSETTGAMHKEGITELHQFLKAYPLKRPKVEKMLEATGPAFRKYISRALASRAAEDEERDVAVQDTLQSKSSLMDQMIFFLLTNPKNWKPNVLILYPCQCHLQELTVPRLDRLPLVSAALSWKEHRRRS